MDKAVGELRESLVKARGEMRSLEAKRKEILTARAKEIEPLTDQIKAGKQSIAEIVRQIEILKYGQYGKGGRLKPKPKPKRKFDRRF